MAWEDYFNGGWDEEAWGASAPFNFAPSIPTCRRCGRSGHWVKTAAGSWYLQHECAAVVSSPTEFEDYSNVVPKTSSTTAGSRPDNRPGRPANTRKQAKIRASRIAKPRAKRARYSRPQAS